MKRKRYPLWRPLVLALVSLLVGLRVYSWNAQSLGGNQLPMPFGYGLSVVLSGSMEPALNVNDLVLIQETQDLQVGDVVVYQSGTELIIHRVIALEGENLVTQGDANQIPDQAITLDQVKGKLVGHVPKVGAVVRVLKRPWVILLILVVALGLMELSYRREFREQRRERERIQKEIQRLKEEE
jgi:signal peptidase